MFNLFVNNFLKLQAQKTRKFEFCKVPVFSFENIESDYFFLINLMIQVETIGKALCVQHFFSELQKHFCFK